MIPSLPDGHLQTKFGMFREQTQPDKQGESDEISLSKFKGDSD